MCRSMNARYLHWVLDNSLLSSMVSGDAQLFFTMALTNNTALVIEVMLSAARKHASQ
jgi:hypothetical protein